MYRVQIICREQKEANVAFKTLLLQSVAPVLTNACETGFPSAKLANGKSKLLKQPLQEWLSKYLPKITHATDPLLLSIPMTPTIGLDLESNFALLSTLSQFRFDFLPYLVGILPTLDMPGITQPYRRFWWHKDWQAIHPNFYAAAIRRCRNKRFFCTKDGAFGIGPQAAQTGDHIVLLYGSNAPCVLRTKGLYYQFVGECYLHQHMHEAIKMAIEELLAIEEFEIR